MPFPSKELQERLRAVRLVPSPQEPASWTWREVDLKYACTEQYITFYADQDLPRIEGDTQFAKRILALLDAYAPATSTTKEEK